MNVYVPVNHQNAMDQLLAAMAAQGIEPTEPLLANGSLERFHVEGDRIGSRNGWGCFHFDSTPAGQFGCKKRYGDHKFPWRATGIVKPMSASERKAQQEEWGRKKAEKADTARKRHADAAALAQSQWNAATLAPDDHPYLKRKAVKAHGLRVGAWTFTNDTTGASFTLTDNALLVPICDKSRAIHSLQAIFPGKILGKGDGARDKDFIKGGRKAGLFHVIGTPVKFGGSTVYILAEGYATGATIHEVTGHCVLVCFDAGNLLPVAEAVRSSKPDAIIVLAADNDQFTTKPIKNPGLHFAMRAAAAVGGLLAVPQFPTDDADQPTDFNDLRCLDGVEAVKVAFDAVFAAHQVIVSENDADYGEARGPTVEASPCGQEDLPDHTPWPLTTSPADDDGIPAANAISVQGMTIMQPHDFPDLSTKLRPLNTIPNLAALMSNFKITARYNLISKETVLCIPGIWGTADNEQNVNLAHLNSIAAHCGLPRENLTDYVKAIADANAYNPVLEWIDSKSWDGTSRIQELADTLVCNNPSFRTLLLRRWLISCAAALLHKGFWTKGVLTLHGAQDLGKTSWFRRLVPAELYAFREGLSLDATSKDSVMTAVSHWIVELGELESTLRRDMENLKAFISQTSDRLRRPYDRVDSEYPRRTVFCASVNSEKFLKDDTGNGRFWVIAVESVDHNHNIDMQQLWAEIVSLYRAGEQWHLTPDEKENLNAGNEKFRQVSPIEEMLTTNYDLGATAVRWITATQLLLEMGYDKPTRSQTTEAGQTLHRLGIQRRLSQGRSIYRIPERLVTLPSCR
jgi:putative DNA primase/helicase